MDIFAVSGCLGHERHIEVELVGRHSVKARVRAPGIVELDVSTHADFGFGD